MLGYILTGIIAFIIGIGFWYWHDRKIINAKQEQDQTLIQQKKQLEYDVQELSGYKLELNKGIQTLQLQEQQYLGKIKGLDESLRQAEEQAKGAADRFYQQSMLTAQERINHSLKMEEERYHKAIEDFEKELEEVKASGTIYLNEELNKRQEAIENAENALKDMQSKVAAAVQASKRAEEMIAQQNFYRIQLSDIDIDEIEKLRSVEPYLRDKEPLNKVIWKVYYEKPTNDLIGRVIGSGTHTGIYKITNIDSQKCYVGQAANLGDRWKQHIKRGVGADAPTRNKLYPAMRELGPENFTFEVIEECERSLLDSREDYWQDYFKAKEFGYSIK